MKIGKILKLVRDKECGEIRINNGDDAHFHKNCLWDVPFGELSEGQEVEFEIEQSHKGYRAFHIRYCKER
jgi:cold shock CspA family protein